MFRRSGRYYILPGTGCCGCVGGSNIYVFTAESPRGPWQFRGDVGSTPGHAFDPHSPDNYVTKAQASAVLAIDGQILWMGNQWNSGLRETPPGPRKHDLLYWTVLQFEEDGDVRQVENAENCSFTLPPSSPKPVRRRERRGGE